MNQKRGSGKYVLAAVVGIAVGGYFLTRDNIEKHQEKMLTAVNENQAVCEDFGYAVLERSWQTCGSGLRERLLKEYQSNPQRFREFRAVMDEVAGLEYKLFSQQQEKEPVAPGLVHPQRLQLQDSVLAGQGRFAVLVDQKTGTKYVVREEEMLGQPVLTLAYNKGIEEKIGTAVHAVKNGVAEGYAAMKEWVGTPTVPSGDKKIQ